MQDDHPAAGRSCPLHYRYSPSSFARPAEGHCEVLYVVGGLYGNEPALDVLLSLFEREQGPKRLVFNGDFNWFNTDPALFQRLNERVLAFDALRGNVETELSDSAESDNGCGCAYPDWVGEGVVQRSNNIMRSLRATASRFPALMQRLAALPMHRRVNVGDCRVAIVHGDAESLAGWGFAQEHLQDPAHRHTARRWFEAGQVDVFASSHTCLPVFHTLPMPTRRVAPVVLNNGAAGMPNFRGDAAGLLTRIALRPFDGPERRFGLQRNGLHLDAIAIEPDPATWRAQFLQQWPEGSDAHASYWGRIANGPAFEPADALITSED
ncbi:MAG: hypothetical protein IV105_19000 [Rhizobacter sp.]|nr:hypothetical protein [Rhizobacter sp.]